MKKSFKERLSALGLSYKREIGVLITLNILCVALLVFAYFILKQLLIVLVGVLVLGIINFLYLSRYSQMERKIEKDHVDELIALLTYFEIYISNKNNVYTSLKMLIPFSSPFMEEALTTLLNQIDKDKSVEPFVAFSNKFSNKIIESLMLSIYQMVDNGEDTRQFIEFDNLFSNVSREFHNSLIEEKSKSLEVMNSFPLFGAGAIVIVLTLSILSVVGEMINVI